MENFYNGSEALLPNNNNVEPEYFFVKSGSKIVKVLWTEVYAITALKNYVKILTIQNPAGYLMRTSLQQTLTKTIPREHQKKFISVSRNTMVNRNFIKEVNSGYVVTPYGRFITNKSFLNTFVL